MVSALVQLSASLDAEFGVRDVRSGGVPPYHPTALTPSSLALRLPDCDFHSS